MGENSLKIKLYKDRWGYTYSIIGVINSARWRPTRSWAIRAAKKDQAKFIRSDEAYRNAEIIS